MMRKFIVFAVLSPLVLQVVAMEPAMEDAIRHGAMAKICYRVIDDEGCPVSNAVAHVWFSSYARHQDDADWLVTTDTNGMFTVEHRTNESLDCGFDKDGYYHSSDQILFRDRKDVPVKVRDGKWQPYGEMRTVVLKKIKNPGTCVIPKQGGQFTWNIPAFGQWIGFDFEDFDWTAPYGCGKSTDILLKFQSKCNRRFVDCEYEMDVCFTNYQYAGAYVCALDKYSDLEIPYCANTNGEFRTSFHFVMKKSPAQRIMECVEQDQCLVFRTRTALDDNGNLKTAHYGVIVGMWGFGDKQMGVGDACFNIIENDVNIEDGRTLRDKIKNYKKER